MISHHIYTDQAAFDQKMDYSIHWTKRYPVYNAISFPNTIQSYYLSTAYWFIQWMVLWNVSTIKKTLEFFKAEETDQIDW